MEAVYYTSIKGNYSKVPCTVGDIANDLEMIKNSLIAIGEQLGNEDAYVQNMHQSIEQGLAFKVYHETTCVGFLYLRKDNQKFSGKLIASSLYIPRDIVAQVILFMTIKLGQYKTIIVFPHGKSLLQYKSFITGTSLRLYNTHKLNYVLISYQQFNNSIFTKLVRLYQIKKVSKL